MKHRTKRQSTSFSHLEEKVKNIFRQGPMPKNWQSTGRDKDIYIKLSEPIVRQAVSWQNKDGRIIDPHEHEERSTTTARFVGALGFLISAGCCLDLVDVCVKSMNRACENLYYSFEKPVPGPEFYVKELMRGYLALKDKVDESTDGFKAMAEKPAGFMKALVQL